MIEIAQYGLLLLFALALVMHFCILLRVIPYDAVWGGRLKSVKDMYRFEFVSILVLIILTSFMLIVANLIPYSIPKNIKIVGLYIMAVLFLLNTFGNIVSKNKFEKIFFMPLTLIAFALSLYLALNI